VLKEIPICVLNMVEETDAFIKNVKIALKG
jgi:hypothetical protein